MAGDVAVTDGAVRRRVHSRLLRRRRGDTDASERTPARHELADARLLSRIRRSYGRQSRACRAVQSWQTAAVGKRAAWRSSCSVLAYDGKPLRRLATTVGQLVV